MGSTPTPSVRWEKLQMKLNNILNEKQPCRLYHPVIGYVRWEDEYGHFSLKFERGPDNKKSLIADETVLFCNQWVKVG